MELNPSQVEARIDQLFREFVYDKCVPTLKGTCPVDTGTLQNSIQAEPSGKDRYFVGTDLEYAKYTEYGRGYVHPVRKKALWWPDINVGHPVAFAKDAPAQRWVEAAVAKLK